MSSEQVGVYIFEVSAPLQTKLFVACHKLVRDRSELRLLCGYWDQCTDLVGDWLRELVLPAQGPS